MQNAAMEADRVDAPSQHAAFVEAKVGDLSPQQWEGVYRSLLEPSFRPEELMSLQDFRSDYAHDDDLSCVLIRDGTPIAVMLGEWYVGGGALLLGYLAVLEEARGSGAGSYLMSSVLPRWYADVPGALVIAEVDDPRCWATDTHRGDPVGRLRFYERHGATLVPFPYFQPSLKAGSPRVRGMLLLRLDHSTVVSPGVLRAFLTEYFTVCEGPEAVNDPEVAELLSNAGALDVTTGMWTISRWPELPTDE